MYQAFLSLSPSGLADFSQILLAFNAHAFSGWRFRLAGWSNNSFSLAFASNSNLPPPSFVFGAYHTTKHRLAGLVISHLKMLPISFCTLLLLLISSPFEIPFFFVYAKTTLFNPNNRDRLLTRSCLLAGPSWERFCHGSVIIMIIITSHTRSLTGIQSLSPLSAASTSRSVTNWSSTFMMPCTKTLCAENPSADPCSWMR